MNREILYRRLVKAFPNMQNLKKVLLLNSLVTKLEKELKKEKELIKNQKKQIKNKERVQ